MLGAAALLVAAGLGAAAPDAAAASRPMQVMALQRSGSYMLSQLLERTFDTAAYAPPNGSAPWSYCLKCVGCVVEGEGGLARNAPGTKHFRIDLTSYRPKPQYRRCRFPALAYSVRALPDLTALYAAPMTFVVLAKEPVAWFISVLKFYPKLDCTDVRTERCAEFLSRWHRYYGRWLELRDAADGAAAADAAPRSALSLVRYEDVLADPERVLDGLGAAYGWRRVRDRATPLQLEHMRVKVSGRTSFRNKQREAAQRTFLTRKNLRAPGQARHEDDPLGWYTHNCAHLRALLANTTVPARLGYDLWYLRKCDPPHVPRARRVLLDALAAAATPPWLALTLAALAAAAFGVRWARRRAAGAAARGDYAQLRPDGG